MRTISVSLLATSILLPQLSLAQPRNAEAKMTVLENDHIRFGANLTLGGVTRSYAIALADNENWKGTITRLAIKPCRKGAEGRRLMLESVRVH
jgi:hypothetical protein